MDVINNPSIHVGMLVRPCYLVAFIQYYAEPVHV